MWIFWSFPTQLTSSTVLSFLEQKIDSLFQFCTLTLSDRNQHLIELISPLLAFLQRTRPSWFFINLIKVKKLRGERDFLQWKGYLQTILWLFDKKNGDRAEKEGCQNARLWKRDQMMISLVFRIEVKATGAIAFKEDFVFSFHGIYRQEDAS